MHFTPEQEEFLSQPYICVIATADSEGQPHAVPVWFIVESSSICVLVGKGSKKHRNLLENPKASLSFDTRSSPYYALVISGPVELVGEASYEDFLRISVKYLGTERAKEYVESSGYSDLVKVRMTSGRVVQHMPG